MQTREAAVRWARVWEAGWRAQDPSEIVALYSPDVLFLSSPFRPHEPPREYIERVFAEERSADCEFGEPVVDGDRAAVEWRATTELVDGGSESLAGVSLLRFDRDGAVVEQRDFWNLG
jgi:ketosteroid isomerase-like protein